MIIDPPRSEIARARLSNCDNGRSIVPLLKVKKIDFAEQLRYYLLTGRNRNIYGLAFALRGEGNCGEGGRKFGANGGFLIPFIHLLVPHSAELEPG